MLERGVLILFNDPAARADGSGWTESDAGVLQEAAAVAAALKTLGIPCRQAAVSRLADVAPAVLAADEEVVFNLVESLPGDPGDVAAVPEVCRALGRGVTGNDGPCQALCLDKWRTKAVLSAHQVPVPGGVRLPVGARIQPSAVPSARMIVKPLRADASEGIDAASIASGAAEVEAAVRRVHERFGEAALVEEFIDGREINVSVLLRGGTVEVLPPAEIDFSAFPPDKPRIVDYAAKWVADSFEYKNTPRKIPAELSEEALARVRQYSLAAWHALGCQDYVRVDFRLAADERPYVLEVNPNPDISPDAGFAAALHAAGIPYEAFVGAMVENAAARAAVASGVEPASEVPVREPREAADDLEIRWSLAQDHKAILRFVTDCGFFRPDELAVAREVLDEALAKGSGGHYQSYTAAVDGEPVGWVCFGPTPCTVKTYDIYWIAVDRRRHRGGIGTRLLARAEAEIAARGGRLSVIETSSRPLYEPTRRFYLKHGYVETGRIPDFYAVADDKCVFTKRLSDG